MFIEPDLGRSEHDLADTGTPGDAAAGIRHLRPVVDREGALNGLAADVGAPSTAQDELRSTGRLTLLGGFRLLAGNELLPVSLTGQRLVALAACRKGPVSRTQVAHLLWPDTTSERAHANLRTAVYRLEHSCPGLVETTNSHLWLAPGLQVDVTHVDHLAKRILATSGPLDSELIEAALHANLTDDLLPDWCDEWLEEYQSRHRQLRLTTLETLAHRLSITGHHGAAVNTALAAVHADAFRDSAHQTLVRACLAQGNRHEAFTHFSAYRRVFRDELGVEPTETFGELVQSVRTAV
ncbi:BTAD domain-containing putative transcriptional regulator [Actinomadura fulvescens]|uniref:Bacterial transcriptional activator domain-containing protein n=1 Tax=Actinomadura fulvescens TaxID=46160 RepID=A0ABN3PEG2_9ACTN